MRPVITIYKEAWGDIAHLRTFFHQYLLTYDIEDVHKNTFKRKIQLPVVSIQKHVYENPTLSELEKTLALSKKAKVVYHDTIVIGAYSETLCFLDYASRHHLDVRCFSEISAQQIETFQQNYTRLFRFPNLSLPDYFIPSHINNIEQVSDGTYLRVCTNKGDVYTKTIFLVLRETAQRLGVRGEENLLQKRIFLDQEKMIQVIKRRRVRTKEGHNYVVYGDHPDMLVHVMTLYDQLAALDKQHTFSLLVLSPHDFAKADNRIVYMLEQKKNTRLIGNVRLHEIVSKEKGMVLRTDIRDYPAEYLLEDHGNDLENRFIRPLLRFDRHGFVEVNQWYQTSLPNIYALRSSRMSKTPDLTTLLDQYLTCAQIAQRVISYLH